MNVEQRLTQYKANPKKESSQGISRLEIKSIIDGK